LRVRHQIGTGRDRRAGCRHDSPAGGRRLSRAAGDTSAQPESDTFNTAVCVGAGSQGNLHVQWKAGGAWKSTGNIGIGCAEILGASSVKVRAVESYTDQAMSYYTCSKE